MLWCVGNIMLWRDVAWRDAVSCGELEMGCCVVVWRAVQCCGVRCCVVKENECCVVLSCGVG
jgi:hypothetical protein